MSAHARSWAARLGDLVAGLVLVAALLLPDRLTATDLGSFVALPVELILGAALLLVLPAAARRPVAAGLGLLLGALTMLKAIDAGFYAALSRPFDPVLDWGLASGAWQLLAASLGGGLAALIVGIALLGVSGLLMLIVWAVLRLTRLLDDHSAAGIPVVAGLAAVWLTCATAGVVLAPPYPVASHASTAKIINEVTGVQDGLEDQRVFAEEVALDDFRGLPADRLLSGLRGKQVVIVFVESYGRVALDQPGIATEVGATLASGDRALAARGLQARSGYLTSPTAGGGSWLAHSTLLSGLWIDGQRRYRTLMASDRFTLTQAFQRSGWHTLGVMPGTTRAWPDGAFYHYDDINDSHDLGYAGPAYGWSRVPDQYTLAQIGRLSTGSAQLPTMIVTPLVTSHAPWTPVPPILDWDDLGDGRVYGTSVADPEPPEEILTRDPARVRSDYARSISYSLRSVISFAAERADDDFVLIMVGDHQPASVVTGADPNRDVPITMITGDPAVLARTDDWQWTPGLQPARDAPVWPMDAFRDRFLAAFSADT